MNPLPLILADLRQNRLGALAIVLLVALAVALGVAVSAQERALREGSTRAADPFDLLVAAPGGETEIVLEAVYLQPGTLDLLPGRDLALLSRDERVAFASPIGFGDSWRGYPIVGVTADLVRHLAKGGELEGAAFGRIDEAVLGAGVGLDIGGVFTPTHGQAALEAVDEADEHAGFAYRAVGRLPVLGSPWDKAILVPIEAVWSVHALPLGHAAGQGEPRLGPPWDEASLPGVPAIVVKPVSVAAAYTLRQEWRARRDATALFPAEVLIRLYGLLGDVRDLVATISLLTQILVIGAVLLAVLGALAQKRRQIAVLRALGAGRGFVFAAVWGGVAVLLGAGAALGLPIGWLASYAVGALFTARSGIALAGGIAWSEVTLVLAIVAIALGLALVPALLAWRGPIAPALRGT